MFKINKIYKIYIGLLINLLGLNYSNVKLDEEQLPTLIKSKDFLVEDNTEILKNSEKTNDKPIEINDNSSRFDKLIAKVFLMDKKNINILVKILFIIHMTFISSIIILFLLCLNEKFKGKYKDFLNEQLFFKLPNHLSIFFLLAITGYISCILLFIIKFKEINKWFKFIRFFIYYLFLFFCSAILCYFSLLLIKQPMEDVNFVD